MTVAPLFHRLPVACTVLGLVLCIQAQAQNDLIAEIGTGTGFAGGPASVEVEFESITRPSAIQFKILFNPAHVTPVSVEASAQVLAAGKQVGWNSQSGLLTVLIAGPDGVSGQSTLNDGDLVTIVFALSGTVTVAQEIPLQGTFITASTPAANDIQPSVITDGSITVGACSPPSVPSDVVATFGTLSDRVSLAWGAATGATSYEVYRSASNNPATATSIATINWVTVYDDLAAAVLAGGGGGNGGCNGGNGTQASFVTYYYWIVARNVCGSSGFSAVTAGVVGQKARLSTKTASPGVLPATGPDQYIDAGASLALRVTGRQPVDPATVWGRVTLGPLTTDAVEWLPVGDADGAGWVVYRPHSAWHPGDLILMTAGARTVTGEPVGPVSAVFHVRSGAGKSATASPAGVQVTLLPHGVAPPTSVDGVGPVCRILPEAPSPDPFLVWLPVPDGLAAGQLNPCYYLGSNEHGAWYPAENVPGWLASGQYLERIEEDAVYLGFWVNHGGIVQLSARTGAVTSTATAVRGDMFLVAAGLLGLALWRRKKSETPSG